MKDYVLKWERNRRLPLGVWRSIFGVSLGPCIQPYKVYTTLLISDIEFVFDLYVMQTLRF